MLERVADWGRYLSDAASDEESDSIRRCTSTGRPAGDELYVEQLEALTGRELKKRKPGRKRKNR